MPRACLLSSINEYRLKYSVAASDADLAALRAWGGWPELAPQLTGYSAASTGTPAATPGAVTAKLRAEAKSPFRLLRLFAFGGLFGGAVIASLVTFPSLLKALSSLSSSPDEAADALQKNVINAAVNIAVLLAAGWAARLELNAKAKAEAVAEREEQLGQLRVVTSGSSSSALAELRGRYRPVLVVGSKAHMRGCARASEPYKRELLLRNVIVLALEDDPAAGAAAAAPAPRGFGAANSGAASGQKGAASSSDAFGGNSSDAGRWRADIFDVPIWRNWASQQRAQLGLQPGEPFWLSLALDGTVRTAAAGAPNWCVSHSYAHTLVRWPAPRECAWLIRNLSLLSLSPGRSWSKPSSLSQQTPKHELKPVEF